VNELPPPAGTCASRLVSWDLVLDIPPRRSPMAASSNGPHLHQFPNVLLSLTPVLVVGPPTTQLRDHPCSETCPAARPTSPFPIPIRAPPSPAAELHSHGLSRTAHDLISAVDAARPFVCSTSRRSSSTPAIAVTRPVSCLKTPYLLVRQRCFCSACVNGMCCHERWGQRVGVGGERMLLTGMLWAASSSVCEREEIRTTSMRTTLERML
jgi:hypothetical protein